MLDADSVETKYTCDAVARMTQVNKPVTTFVDDANGQTVAQKNENGTRTSFTFDAAGQTLEIFHQKSDNTVFSSMTYTYDPVGNRTSLVELDASRTTWSYDNTYQLTQAQRNGPTTTVTYDTTYTYDPVGNRLLLTEDGARTTYTYNAANQIQTSLDSTGTTTFIFDADGNQQTEHEPNGDRTTNTWDYENRLTEVALPTSNRETYSYNPDNLRVKKNNPSTGPISFLWDFQNLYAEIDELGTASQKYWYKPEYYGELLASSISGYSTYHFDALGSTMVLTDSAENVTDEYLYEAFGGMLFHSGTSKTPVLYLVRLGYYFDFGIEACNVRRRALCPSIGLWLSKDPILFYPKAEQADMFVFDEVIHAYQYLDNNPVNKTDPSGLGNWMNCASKCFSQLDIDQLFCRADYNACIAGGGSWNCAHSEPAAWHWRLQIFGCAA